MARHLRRLRALRPMSVVTAAAIGLAGVVLSATGAAAAPPIGQVPQVSLAYTDERTPTTSYPQPTGELPLGSWLDEAGTAHKSRAYASFDLAGYADKDAKKRVVSAWLIFGETSATSYVPRSIEVWQTATSANPVTWRRAPAERKLLGTVTTSAGGPAAYMRLDLTAAAAAAATTDGHTLSLELRLPEADESNSALGRHLNTRMFFYATANTKPGAPTELYTQDRACATTTPHPFIPTLTPSLTAMLHDPDPSDEYLTGHFAIWPTDSPEQRTEFTGTNMLREYGRSASVPAGLLADGGTYSWQVQGGDGTDRSAWSKPCTFRVDTSLPTAAPVLTSTNYPAGQTVPGGVPGEFTLKANSVADVAGYQYSWSQDFPVNGWWDGPNGVPVYTDPFSLPGTVRASRLGGAATLSLTPPRSGPNVLYVRSVDRAFNPSPATSYWFYVPDTAPVVTGLPDPVLLGTPFTLHLAPNASLATADSYTVQLNYETPFTVPAASDGTASVPFTLDREGGNVITVRSHSPNGWVSSESRVFAHVDTSPTVTSEVYPEYTGEEAATGGVGVAGVFTFAPKVQNTASYTYSFDWGTTTTVPAEADGTAQVSWTPDTNGVHTLTVYAKDRSGKTYQTRYYEFNVS